MEFLNACMKETLRIHPPLIVLLRKLKTDLEYNGMTLPKGDIIACCPPISHRVPEIYENPLEWDPDRFLAPREEDKKEKFSFIAFGGGRHGCLGERFAFIQVKTIWTVLLRSFDWEPVSSSFPEDDYDHIVAGPRPPCKARFKRRK